MHELYKWDMSVWRMYCDSFKQKFLSSITENWDQLSTQEFRRHLYSIIVHISILSFIYFLRDKVDSLFIEV